MILNRIRKILYPIGLLAGILLLGLQTTRTIKELGNLHSSVDFSNLMVLAALIAFLATGVQMISWNVIMAGLGVRIPLLHVVSGYSLSFIPRYIPGTIWGYLSRGEWLKRVYGVDFGLSALGSIIEVVVLITANLLITGIYIIFNLSGFVKILVIILECTIPILIWIICNKIFQQPFLWKFLKLRDTKGFVKFPFSKWTMVLAMSSILWLIYGYLLFNITGKFHPNDLTVTYLEIAAIYSISWLVGFVIIFVPSGLGVREVVMSTLLSISLSNTFSQNNAITIFTRLALILAEIIWVLFGIFLSTLKIRGNPKVNNTK